MEKKFKFYYQYCLSLQFRENHTLYWSEQLKIGIFQETASSQFI